MTYYMYQRRPMIQARTYTAQPSTEGSMSSIVSWISGMYPPGYVEATEIYDSTIDQMVMNLKIGDTSPVNENTPAIQVIVGEWLALWPNGGGVTKYSTYEQLQKYFEIIG